LQTKPKTAAIGDKYKFKEFIEIMTASNKSLGRAAETAILLKTLFVKPWLA
jgi:hypothetical protein